METKIGRFLFTEIKIFPLDVPFYGEISPKEQLKNRQGTENPFFFPCNMVSNESQGAIASLHNLQVYK